MKYFAKTSDGQYLLQSRNAHIIKKEKNFLEKF